ncbi:5-(carboxyamino)imidazole ribonucleotide mutase [Lactococcus formosensis]|jgi:5-(carboxyamino)imidazole ribonucleotide mutase|uniref:N5-carboxyaminoimidazole ribonucleotide mutase n=1 Tax=Lactococcus formosensis TaxID=1281486 RepID=A0A9Q9D642_9LACT|nr:MULTISPECIES: 5-(carboxyamino)imidazole ribonucleotide mutase [Lactococcus]MDG6110978.1 5-(carboxyamino)imidazole ribonucleotide mutase [Lactococcus formosensis]MDG6117414.1 5-(carboxyamino)imidazole ribonucleotide mutase [Lactococcus formosensis]MDG6132870.1 5-(carboxyamino)imidazole ribonucleotide mutase [Lactococcus formosensis]MDG6134865.1 5-(carboxyamino)imidazole ribonucleotide mutase [Lactococcus formosensis]MDG6137876.1 5-(carboxyamino)imidazole ribonucleotide mutase [Lactococcus fo
MADVAVIMGSLSDWETMKQATHILEEFGIDFDKKIVSAHRTPEIMMNFAKNAEQQGYKLIIAGAGGAAHLPGMVAAMTLLPVIGVPIQSRALSGLDSLYSIVQMPGGVPVASMAIGTSGAKNAALYAIQILALADKSLVEKLKKYRKEAADISVSSTKELL